MLHTRERPEMRMLKYLSCATVGILLVAPAAAQRRLWILTQPDLIVEYDPATFAPKRTLKIPAEVLKIPRILQINHKGQMLFAPNNDDPSPDVGKNGERFWLFDGQSATMLGRGMVRITGHA